MQFIKTLLFLCETRMQFIHHSNLHKQGILSLQQGCVRIHITFHWGIKNGLDHGNSKMIAKSILNIWQTLFSSVRY